MRDEADFVAYMAARWPLLVRALMLLGSPRDEAEAVARTALARCYGAWDAVLEADDVDVCVYREVLECRRKARRRRGRAPGVPAGLLEAVPAIGLPDAVLLRQALMADLAGLSPEYREVLVLRFAAGLSPQQVADILEVPGATVAERTRRGLAGLDLDALREMVGP